MLKIGTKVRVLEDRFLFYHTRDGFLWKESKGLKGKIGVIEDILNIPQYSGAWINAFDAEYDKIILSVKFEDQTYNFHYPEYSVEEVKEYKDLLGIRRKARRAGGHVAPGMRKYTHPRIAFKKLYKIDLADVPIGFSAEDYIHVVKEHGAVITNSKK